MTKSGAPPDERFIVCNTSKFSVVSLAGAGAEQGGKSGGKGAKGATANCVAAAGKKVQAVGKQTKQQQDGAAVKGGDGAKAGAEKVEGAPAASTGPKSFVRRDTLRDIEKRIQKKWTEHDAFITQAAFDADGKPKPKYLATFPYPYMNGRLHLGHAYSMTKAEFATRFHRLLGKNALFPFGFHCTGMPIQAAANKLKMELETYGNPPVFPSAEEEEENSDKQEQREAPSAEAAALNKAKGKKSKAVSKTAAGVVRQWDILKMMVDEREIAEFSDPHKWLSYFPPYGKQDLIKFGVNTDWRRSFITTSVNKVYDSFIRWQFRLLKERGRVKFGKRPNVFSPRDGQVCADHDRASGEGVGPQEYTIIKLKVLELRGKLSSLEGKDVFLGPATLRPETMYGQTNCFMLPEGDYGAYEMASGDVLIISARSALGLSYQDQCSEWGKPKALVSGLKGWDLMGLPLKAPNAAYDKVYTLPLLTISMSKGTGVVTSVPSDAPDDYVALRELKDKPDYRAKFNLTDEMVMPYEVVPIIDIPGYGDQAAVTVSEELKIKSPKDVEKLKEAKERVYLKGFYEGVLKVGPYKGQRVCDAKPIIKDDMIKNGDALVYYEPESLVMSRSGDECVVATTDQWYLSYGEEDWKERVSKHLHSQNFSAFSPRTLEAFDAKVAWLKEWACSRQFGLGTQLPWDEQWVIESLSDSTIYMAYYTIAHMLHGDDNLDGSKPSPIGVTVEQLTDQVWSYIFLKGPLPTDSDIPRDKLDLLRREFEYWYPMDLRVSAKDLIPNHLTMALYNHTEVWRDFPELWPRGIFCNGHILVNAEKMSKSKGNFLMLEQCVEEFSADATRLALADAGDTLDDANFAVDTANAAILSLFVEEQWVRDMVAARDAGQLRKGAPESSDFFDRAFENDMNRLVAETKDKFTRMLFREGLKSGFYDFQIARDSFRDWSKVTGVAMREDLVLRFIEWQAIQLAPICPHWCEHIWELLGRDGLIMNALWPEAQPEDKLMTRQADFLRDMLRSFRLTLIKAPKGTTKASAYFVDHYPPAETATINILRELLEANNGTLPDDAVITVKDRLSVDPELKKELKNVMKFAAARRDDVREGTPDALELTIPFDQRAIVRSNLDYVLKNLGLTELELIDAENSNASGDEKTKKMAKPGRPSLLVRK